MNIRNPRRFALPVAIVPVVLMALAAGALTARRAAARQTGGAITYRGPHADVVRQLLTLWPNWKTGSPPDGEGGVPPKIDLPRNPHIRDTYVAAAVTLAWGAEAYARVGKDSRAETVAVDMMKNLKQARDLCDDRPVVENSSPPLVTARVTCQYLRGLNYPKEARGR